MSQDFYVAFQSRLLSLGGLPCWSFKAGAGTGSRLHLDFGGKIARVHPLKNKSLTEEQKLFTGEMSLFIESEWRLDSATEVLAGCGDDNRPGREMLIALSQLVGQSIVIATAEPPGYDLVLKFSGGLVLRVFCTATNPGDQEDNYSLFDHSSVLTVGTRSLLEEEQLSGAQP